MIDLHIHSNYSDGSDSIEKIIEQAKLLNLNQISITDHNILDGSIYANSIYDKSIIGVELSTNYNDIEVHVLGYFPNGSNFKNVKFVINEGEAYKKVAILETIENLNNIGIEIKIAELSEFAKGIINRVHICQVLMKHGYISSINEGFEKYVGDGCPAYVERKTVPLKEIIDSIHLDNGIAVIAHPYEYDKLKSIDDFLIDIINDIDGIECFHPSATKEQAQHLMQVAKDNKKIITGGSDYHGINKPEIKINMMNVDDKYIIKTSK